MCVCVGGKGKGTNVGSERGRLVMRLRGREANGRKLREAKAGVKVHCM